MSTHAINDTIRPLDHPQRFSADAHGEGWRFEIRDGEATPYPSRRFGLFRRVDRHVFVREWRAPKEYTGWRFRWAEGTNAIRFDFEATFVIGAANELQARNLARVLLGRSGAAGEVLFELINASLHRRLAELLAACEARDRSLLDEFRRSFVGGGECDALDQAVTRDVAASLGATFRVGFKMASSLPSRVEVSCKNSFTLSDSRRERMVETTALLRLENYQLYKRSGLDTAEDVEMAIRGAIADAVKETLFAQRYYDIVRAPSEGRPSIEARIEARIKQAARAIGYGVDMFHTFADIAALRLIAGMAIEIPAGSENYVLLNSTGIVQMSASLRVKTIGNFPRLHLLVAPDEPDPAVPVINEVHRICRESMRQFDYGVFNLDFEEKIAPILRERVAASLAAYGLEAEGIVFMPMRTQEGARFRMLRGAGAIRFFVEVSAQADRGDADPVTVEGSIEITDLADGAWQQFESKDFGFRDDSPYSEAQILDRLVAHRASPSSHGYDRKALAIALELVEIRDRVVDVLKRDLAMVPNLAREWTSDATQRKIIDWAGRRVAAAIREEYGLEIALRGFGRQDTLTDTTMRKRLVAQHDYWQKLDKQAFDAEVIQQGLLRDILDGNRRELHKLRGKRDLMSLELDDDPAHDDVSDRVEREDQALEARRQVAVDSASSRLPPVRPDGERRRLPWDEEAADPPSDPQPDPASDTAPK